MRSRRSLASKSYGCVPAAKMADLLDETRQLTAIFTVIDKKAKGQSS